MNKPVNRDEAIQAANVLIGYCNTFYTDNKTRAKRLNTKALRISGESFIEAKRQLANHKGQRHYIKKIELLAKGISEILENNVTYRR